MMPLSIRRWLRSLPLASRSVAGRRDWPSRWRLSGFEVLEARCLLSPVISAIRPEFSDQNQSLASLGPNDDSSTDLVNLGFRINFFGHGYTGLYVNNNGNVTFNEALGTFTPFPLNTTNTPIIAPFFGDVYTESPDPHFPPSGVVTYGPSTILLNGHTFRDFGVTWNRVGYFANNDKLNNFQLVLIDRPDKGTDPDHGDDFDIEFNYSQVQWETGGASGGTDGLGGNAARVGYANGTTQAGTFFELPGSATPGSFLDSNPNGLVHTSQNSTQLGRYVFPVQNGAVTAFTQVTAASISSTEGQPFSGRVASFHETNPALGAGDFSATIDWGDNNTSPGTVTANNSGGFDIAGSHTFEEEGSFPVAITIQDSLHNSTTANGSATIDDAALAGNTLSGLTATVGVPFDGTVARFTDADPKGTASDYSATIFWGDGASTPGVVVPDGAGFDVTGTHAYTAAGPNETLHVVVNDGSGASLTTANATLTVAPEVLTDTTPTASYPTVEGSPTDSRVLMTFTDTNPDARAADFGTPSVDWGGTLVNTPTVSVQLVSHSAAGSLWEVVGNPTYRQAGTYTVNVSVQRGASGPTAATSKASFAVSDAALHAGTLTPPAATEGAAFVLVPVFSVTDDNPAASVGDFTAVVTLGDGRQATLTSTDQGNGKIVAQGDQFVVQLSSSYAEELAGQTFGVQVTDRGGASTGATTNDFTVADATLTPGSLTPPAATEGQAFHDVTVFHFTDANPAATAADFTALVTVETVHHVTNANSAAAAAEFAPLVTLGNAHAVTLTAISGPNGQIVASGDGFDVQLSDTYAEELSGATFSVQVRDSGGASTGASTTTFAVADAPLTAGALTPPMAVAGQPFQNVPIFHFTDANTLATAADFAALVVPGDGSSILSTLSLGDGRTVQVVASPGGGFDVQLSYTYAKELTGKTFSVIVSDQGGTTTTASANDFQVADAPLTAGALTPPQAVEGQPFANVPVLHFTDADPLGTASDYTAVVTLGDGHSVTLTSTPGASGQIVASGNGFDVQLSYTYIEELSGQTFGVQVTDSGDASAGASRKDFAVADAALTAGKLTPPQATEGQRFVNAAIFPFTDASAVARAMDFTALVTPGDGKTITLTGTPSADGQIVAAEGGFVVQLSHTYAEELSGQVFAVDLTDAGGSKLHASISPFAVADASLAGANTVIRPVEGVSFTGTVAQFTDADPKGTEADYQATIAWGDGSSSPGTVTANHQGGFDVAGTHTYVETGLSAGMHVFVWDAGGATLTTTDSTVPVADAGLTDTTPALPFSATEGQTTGQLVLATFTDANPNAPGSDFSATVNWGGTVSNASLPAVQLVARTANGSTWQVVAQAAYAEEGTYSIAVQVKDADGASLKTTNQTVRVDDASLSATGLNVAPARGIAFSNVPVATFTDANPNAAANDFRAVVTWSANPSDTSPGIVVAKTTAAGTVFQVLGGHQYDTEKDFTITVTIADAGGTFVTTTGTAAVQAAQAAVQDVKTLGKGETTGTITAVSKDRTIPSAAVTIKRPSGEDSNATISLAVFQNPAESSSPNSNTSLPPPPAHTESAAFWDLRAVGVTSDDTITLVIDIPDGKPMPGPNDVYDYSAASGWVRVQGSTKVPNSLVIDANARTVTIILDDTSTPAITELTGTIFAINVPVATPSTTTVTTPVVEATSLLSPTTDTGSGLSQASTFQTTSEVTLTLTSAQGSQLSASQAGLSNSAGPATAASAGVRESGGSLADDAARLLWENRDNDLFWWWLQVKETTNPTMETVVAGMPGETESHAEIVPALAKTAADTLFASCLPQHEEPSEAAARPKDQPLTLSLKTEHWMLAVALAGIGLPRWREEEQAPRRRR